MNTHRTSPSNPMRPTVLIIGARGRFGLAASRAFSAAGWRVLAQLRCQADQAKELAAVGGVELLSIPLDDTVALAHAAQGAGIVIHAANPPYTNEAWRTVAPALLDKSIAVTRMLKACLMFPGNVYNFGLDMPERLTETTPQRATTVKGASRIAMEQQLAQATADGHMRAVVIRAGDFFGSGKGSWFDRSLTPQLPKATMGYLGDLGIPTAWAYLPDLAQTFVQVATKIGAQPDCLESFDVLHFAGYSLSGQDWQGVLTDLAWEHGWLGRDGRLTVKHLPWTLIRLGSWFNAVWAALLEMRYLWQRAHRLDNSKLSGLIGDEPHTPLPVAVRASLADLGLLKPIKPAQAASCQVAGIKI